MNFKMPAKDSKDKDKVSWSKTRLCQILEVIVFS